MRLRARRSGTPETISNWVHRQRSVPVVGRRYVPAHRRQALATVILGCLLGLAATTVLPRRSAHLSHGHHGV
jgi:hypothetical protein